MLAETVDRAESAMPGSNQGLPLEKEPSVSLAMLLMLLRDSRRTILSATCLGVALAVAIAFLIAPKYTSTASFIPPSTSSNSSAAAVAAQLSSLGGSSLLAGQKSPGDLYVGILKSRSIASELIKRFDLMRVYKVQKESQAEKLLASRTAFEVGLKDSIVTVHVTDKSPARARDLANAYIEALEKANDRLALSEASQRRLFFGQQLGKEKDDLERAEIDLKQTEEQSGLIAPVGQTATEIQIIAQTRAQISARQVQLTALRQSATEQNPEVIRLQSEIASLQGQLSRLQTGSDQRGTGGIPTSKVPALELDFVRKTREVKYHEALFEMLARQYESARMDEAREAPLLQVLDPASYPDTASSPARFLIILMGLVIGSLVGSGWVLLRDRIRSSLALRQP